MPNEAWSDRPRDPDGERARPLVSPSPGITYAGIVEKPKILTARELRAIMPRLSGWKLAQNKLSRTFEFQDFVQSLSFVNSLVAYFETVDHHPDVRIAYGEVTFELTRYDLGGRVTDRDVEVAKKITSMYRSRS
jgi:4a-hydroxytetrahydrobiopterin dehydratase